MTGEARRAVADQFTPEQYRRLRETLTRIARALPLCEDAEACGVNATGHRAAFEALQQQLTEIESRFMTPPPAGVHDV